MNIDAMMLWSMILLHYDVSTSTCVIDGRTNVVIKYVRRWTLTLNEQYRFPVSFKEQLLIRRL